MDNTTNKSYIERNHRLSLGEEKVSFYICYLALCFIVGGLALSWINGSPYNISSEVILTYCINGVLSLCALFSATRLHAFSLVQFHWIFYLVFFFLAPLQQYCNSYWPWSLVASDAELITTNLLLFGWGVCFQIGVAFGTRGKTKIRAKASRETISISDATAVALVAVSTICVGYLVATEGFERLFLRAVSDADAVTTVGLVNSVIMIVVPLYCFMFILVRYIASKKGAFIVFISALLIIIACFPTGAARFMAAGVYLGFLLWILEYCRCPKGWTSLILIAGIAVAFPFLDMFRYYSPDEVLSKLAADPFCFLVNGFLSGNFDAYSMVIQVEHYVAMYGNTNGNQIVGALLFFIPRTIWSGKPTITGPMVFEAFGRDFTNVATSIPAEAYIDFGLVGVLIIGALLGGLLGRIDKAYWRSCEDEVIGFLRMCYPFLLPLFFFTMRGSLMAGFPYVVGVGVVCMVFIWLLRVRDDSGKACVSELRHKKRRRFTVASCCRRNEQVYEQI